MTSPAPAGVRPVPLALLLVVATLALYSPVHWHPFVNYDDSLYVTNNLQVQAPVGWDTVVWAFTTFDVGTWHPLTWLSHVLDFQLFQLNPAGPHDVNLLLHAINVVLLFWVLLRATGYAGRSFMVAALFALHPVNVESVAWIAERKNVLSMLFFLLALGAYRRYVGEPRTARYAAVAVLYALGLLCKPQVVTFPFVLLLWDYWPLRRTGKPSWLVAEKLPLFALSAASAFITMQAQRAGADKIWYPLSIRIGNAIVSYALYLRNAAWPTRLAVFYPHPGDSLRAAAVAASLLLLTAITALVIVGRRERYLVTGWFWFLGTMVPMLGLEGVGYQGMQGMADRYAYLPFIGLFIMVCWAVPDWAEQKHIAAAWPAALGFALLAILAVQSNFEIGYWRDSAALWTRALQVTDRNWLAENNLGKILMSQGRVEEGVSHFLKATEIYPADPVSNMNLGMYEQQRGNLPAAIARFKTALGSSRDRALRSAAFTNMGRAYRDLGDTARAEECFAAAQSHDVP